MKHKILYVGFLLAALIVGAHGAQFLNIMLFHNATAPGTPTAGTTQVYIDSSTGRLSDKNTLGTGNTVLPDNGAAHDFLTSIGANGVVGKAQPASTDLSDSASGTWTPTLSSTGGAFGAGNVTAGRWFNIGKRCFVNVTIVIGAAGSGTATGPLSVTLPPSGACTTSVTGVNQAIPGKEITVSGGKLAGGFLGTAATSITNIVYYDATTPIANNAAVILQGSFEAN